MKRGVLLMVVCLAYGAQVALAQSEQASEGFSIPYIGASVISVEDAENERALRRAGVEQGAVVTSIEGPAAEAELQVGDVILIAFGRKIDTRIDFLSAWPELQSGEAVELTAWRDGRTHQVTLTPTERESDLHRDIWDRFYGEYLPLEAEKKALIINFSRTRSWIATRDRPVVPTLQRCRQSAGERCLVMHMMLNSDQYWTFMPLFWRR